MNKTKNYLDNKYWRMTLYMVPAIIFMYLLIDYYDRWYFESSFGVSYLFLFSSGFIIFLYQALRNSLLGWFFCLLLYLIYLKNLIFEFQNLYPVKTDASTLWYFGLFFFLYILFGLVYWSIRPEKRVF